MIKISSILVIIFIFSFAQGFPQEIQKCKKSDEACFIKRANELLKNLDLLRKIGIPDIDPMSIKKMDIDQGGNSSVTINLKFRNCHFTGLADGAFYKISGFQADPDKNKLDIRLKTPLGVLQGPYQIKGRMLILPIEGKGDIVLKFKNLDASIKAVTKKVIKDGKVYMHIEKSKFNYVIGGSNVHFSNLFNGDKALGDNMNFFLNENAKVVLEELHKPITSAFNDVLRELLNEMFSNTPYDEFFEQ